MATLKNINPFSKSNPNTGFGTQANWIGGRFVNKDGSFNIRKEGWPLWRQVSVYSFILELTWIQFFGLIVLCYIILNLVFTGLYLLLGFHQLQGYLSNSIWGKVKEVF